MINSLVSILIPVYNRESIIEKCIQSAIDQTYDSIEVVVVDNASTDNTWNLLQKLASENANVRIFRNNKNIGPVLNWEKCLDYARGEFVKFLWSDDLIHKDFVKKTVPLFDNKDVGLVFTSVSFFRQDPDKLSMVWNYWEKSGVFSSSKYLNSVLLGIGNDVPISASCAIFKSDAIKRAFMKDIPNDFSLSHKDTGAGTDAMMFIHTAYLYPNIGYIKEALSYFSYGYNSITKEQGPSLKKYYYTAYYFFVEKYWNAHLTLFKTRVKYELDFNFNEKFDNDSHIVLNGILLKINGKIARIDYIKLVIRNIFYYTRNNLKKVRHKLKI